MEVFGAVLVSVFGVSFWFLRQASLTEHREAVYVEEMVKSLS